MDIEIYKQNLKKKIQDAYNDAQHPVIEDALDPNSGSAKERADLILTARPIDDDMASFVEKLLEIVANKNESVSVRLAAMKALSTARFQGPLFAPHMDDYHSTLRKVADDQSGKLREYAISGLAMDKDSYIFDKLLKGLEQKIAPLVPEDKAILYLSYDEHSSATEVVRNMFDTLGERAKESAVRILASDKGSEGILAKVMGDKKEKSALRCLSAAGLKNLSPETFKSAAEKIMSNDTDFDEIKALCVSALTNNIKGDRSLIDDGVVQKVRDIRSRSRSLRSAVKRFVDHL